MKRTFFISLGLVVALSLSFLSCEKRPVCSVSLTNTISGSAAFDVDGATEKTMDFYQGDTVRIVATPKEGCEFSGWFEGKEKTPVSREANYTFVAERSISLLARFAKSPVVSFVTLPSASSASRANTSGK